MRKSVVGSVSILFLCLSTSVLAQSSTSEGTVRLSPTVIDGSKEPGRISDRTIQSALMTNLAMLLQERPERFAATARGIGLSSADTNAMKPHLSRLHETLVTLRQQSKTSSSETSNLVQRSDPVQRAALARPIVEAINRGTIDAWDGVLDSLSSRGRDALLRYMEREKRNVKVVVPSPAPSNLGSAQ